MIKYLSLTNDHNIIYVFTLTESHSILHMIHSRLTLQPCISLSLAQLKMFLLKYKLLPSYQLPLPRYPARENGEELCNRLKLYILYA